MYEKNIGMNMILKHTNNKLYDTIICDGTSAYFLMR